MAWRDLTISTDSSAPSVPGSAPRTHPGTRTQLTGTTLSSLQDSTYTSLVNMEKFQVKLSVRIRSHFRPSGLGRHHFFATFEISYCKDDFFRIFSLDGPILKITSETTRSLACYERFVFRSRPGRGDVHCNEQLHGQRRQAFRERLRGCSRNRSQVRREIQKKLQFLDVFEFFQPWNEARRSLSGQRLRPEQLHHVAHFGQREDHMVVLQSKIPAKIPRVILRNTFANPTFHYYFSQHFPIEMLTGPRKLCGSVGSQRGRCPARGTVRCGSTVHAEIRSGE